MRSFSNVMGDHDHVPLPSALLKEAVVGAKKRTTIKGISLFDAGTAGPIQKN